MKRLIFFCVLAATCSNVSAEEVIESGGLCYMRSGSGVVVTASTSGGYSGDIVVPEEINVGDETLRVTGVEAYAFYGNSDVNSVSIGSGVTWIGRAAMGGCTGLERVDLPESLISLGEEAFWGCPKLVEVTGGENLTEAGTGVFRDCKSLVSYTLPSDLTEVSDAMFDGCGSLTHVVMSDDVSRIGSLSFKDCHDLEALVFPSELSEIGERAFSGSGLSGYVTIPQSVESVGAYAFSDCSEMIGIELPEQLKVLEEGVLSHTAIREMKFPDEAVEIGMAGVSECENLERILLWNEIEKIGIRSFAGCGKLREVWINNTLPPVMEHSTFDSDTYASCTLFVPAGCKAIYSQSPNWDRFGRIVETYDFAFSGVRSVEPENPEVRVSRGVVKIGCKESEQWRIYGSGGEIVAEGRGAADRRVDTGIYVVAVRGYKPLKINVR